MILCIIRSVIVTNVQMFNETQPESKLEF